MNTFIKKGGVQNIAEGLLKTDPLNSGEENLLSLLREHVTFQYYKYINYPSICQG